MYKLDFHADDYGLSLNASREILHLINEGKLDSTSILPNMSCYESALDLWRKELSPARKPGCSVHLNFMEGYCCGPKEQLDLLVNDKGLFRISWGTLIKYNYHVILRSKAKAQLKTEIKAQIAKVADDYGLLEGEKLRIDSHQHTHMIPLVWEALTEVLQEEKYATEYIRLSKEDIVPYLKEFRLYGTYRPVNLVKVMVLNWYSGKAERSLQQSGISSMRLCGVFFSGKMDVGRVSRIFPVLNERAKKRGLPLEILFHPGTLLQEEAGEDMDASAVKKFYQSQNRSVEAQALLCREEIVRKV